MISRTTQNWAVGQTVKVGFLSLVVKAAVPTPGDCLPDAYILANTAGTQLYKFVPHKGVAKIDIEEARAMVEAAGASAARIVNTERRKPPSIKQLPGKGAYARAWKKLCDLPPDAMVKALSWGLSPMRAEDLRTEFRQALDRRINGRGGIAQANVPLPIELVRDAHRLDDIRNRIRVYQFETRLCQRRFGHLLAVREAA